MQEIQEGKDPICKIHAGPPAALLRAGPARKRACMFRLCGAGWNSPRAFGPGAVGYGLSQPYASNMYKMESTYFCAYPALQKAEAL